MMTMIHRCGTRTIPAILIGGLAATALTAYGSVPTANASCLSAFGFGNSESCTSTRTSVAIAIGASAQSHADGLFGAAIALGANSSAQTNSGAVVNLAAAVGDNSQSVADGYGSAALVAGANSTVVSGLSGDIINLAISLVNGPTTTYASGSGNLAVTLFGSGLSQAQGNLNTTLNIGGTSYVAAIGVLNSGINLLGNNNRVVASGPATGSWAFSALGNDNTVSSGPGPLAIAGSVVQTGATITHTGPGININGLVIGSAASVKAPTPATAATDHSARHTEPVHRPDGHSRRGTTARPATAANRR
jgi:hypothetical protein